MRPTNRSSRGVKVNPRTVQGSRPGTFVTLWTEDLRYRGCSFAHGPVRPDARAHAMGRDQRHLLEWERAWKAGQGRVDVAELCRMHGVSRPTGYRWIRRYMQSGFDLRAMADRSSRPHSSPTAVDDDVQDYVVTLRKQHPRWGPRKLRA